MSEIELKSDCTVFTYKEGLLSRVAHDLKLRFEQQQFFLDQQTGALRANFDTTSLRVMCARVAGNDAPSLLSKSDVKKIEQNLRKDVLKTHKHPNAALAGTVQADGAVAVFSGSLELCGVRRSLEATATLTDTWRASYALHQPDFGITPFSAVLGTLKVKPSVDVQVSITPPKP